jgi:23S rRNA (cytosine1962-C5)-methyltransferase
MLQKLILKPGKEKAVKNRHHWIFSGAVEKLPQAPDGDLVSVHSASGTFLGIAYFNRNASILARMIGFTNEPIETILEQRIAQAVQLRAQLFDPSLTNAYRLINGEGDFLPGLIVDRYADTLIMQISTLGMEHLRAPLLNILRTLPGVRCIHEKSDLPSRKEEGLTDFEKTHVGVLEPTIEIRENTLKFLVSLQSVSQKTGFFIDQRNMRVLVQKYAQGKRVLNCFGFTGAFSVYALAGGAVEVATVDVSAPALALAKTHVELNGFDPNKNQFIDRDVFQFLREDSLNYGLVILDPPAFAKRKKDIVPACRGYKDINRLAIQNLPAHSFLLTCSCSYFVDETLFRQVVFQAASEAGRNVRILSKHHLAEDHPVNLFHPEGEYLKSLFLYIE